jgi:hypothetical protein
MKCKSEFMKSATGQFGVYSEIERINRIGYYIDCLDDLLDAIEADDTIDTNWLKMHIKCLCEEMPVIK